MIDMVEGNRAADLRRWTANADPGWLAEIEVVATDLAESFRAGLSPTSLTPAASPTRSMSCGSPTAASTRSAAASRTRPWAIGAARHDPLYPDPQAAAHRHRTPRRAGLAADAARPTRR